MNAEPGWYPPDPARPRAVRYWDGSAWTDHHHDYDADRQAQQVPAPPVASNARPRQPWYTSWWAVTIGFVLYAIPGAVLLWLRRGTPRAVKIAGSVVALPLALLMIGGAMTATTESRDAAEAAQVSASPSPTPSASVAAPSASATPSETPIATATPSATPSAVPVAPPPAGNEPSTTAREVALTLTVKGRAPKTGYARELFGPAWVDVDRNGCDTRNDELALRLTNKEMSGRCKVLAGDLDDPYTATTIHFEYGGASEVDIDHIVALSDAWQKGAAPWAYAKRVAFANDPLNLEPVDSAANRAKGDGDAATWLPPNKAWRCDYVARQVAVKAKYGVWVTQAELDAMLRVLDTCPDFPLPAFGDQPTTASNTGGPPPTQEPAPEPAPAETTTAPAPAETTPAATEPANPGNSKNCGDFSRWRDAQDWYEKYFPYYGDVAGLDGNDNDGIVCESLAGAP